MSKRTYTQVITMNGSKIKREWRRWRYATPLKLNISYMGVFLCCPHKLGLSKTAHGHFYTNSP